AATRHRTKRIRERPRRYLTNPPVRKQSLDGIGVNFHAAHPPLRSGEWRKPPLIAQSFGRGADQHDAIANGIGGGETVHQLPGGYLGENGLGIASEANRHGLRSKYKGSRVGLFKVGVHLEARSTYRLK